MLKGGGRDRLWEQPLVETSPLRRADPRTKLLLCLVVSLAVMLPLERLAYFVAGYLLLLLWAGLLPAALRQVWRARWPLLVLFVLDVWLVNLELAVTVSLRIAILTGVFALFFSTTTPRELSLALEALRLPYRYAFSISLAVASLSLLSEEWQAIREAQTARGVRLALSGWRGLRTQVQQYVAFTVPAVVLTTRRAWNATEAAYARGFDSPHRAPFRSLQFIPLDYLLAALSLAAAAAMIVIK